ncbi:MAG: hypothetical protein ACI9QD_000939 [Thermoproteota archaeon]|jgi:hypothetical protein
MKVLLLGLTLLTTAALSNQASAGTLINKRNDQQISVQCNDRNNSDVCLEFNIKIDGEDNTEFSRNLSTTMLTKKACHRKKLNCNTHVLNYITTSIGAGVLAIAPSLTNELRDLDETKKNSKTRKFLSKAATVGLAFLIIPAAITDIARSPITLVRQMMKKKKAKKLLATMTALLSDDQSLEVNNRTYKKISEVFSELN